MKKERSASSKQGFATILTELLFQREQE